LAAYTTPEGADFTAGAVHRAGEVGNWFVGWLGGLAVYRRALAVNELAAAYPQHYEKNTPIVIPHGLTRQRLNEVVKTGIPGFIPKGR
jgi:hypothetical protein